MRFLICFLVFLISATCFGQQYYGGSGDPHWHAPVASAAALPATGNNVGDLRIETTTFSIYTWNGATWLLQSTAGAAPGTVTSVSVVAANGFDGTVATSTTTPAITIKTTVNGMAKGNGTALSAATAGTDYSAGTSALATGILKSTTATGALSIAAAGTDYQTPISTSASVAHQFLTAFTAPNTISRAQPVCADLSDGVASCSTDTTNANNISSGLLITAVGGTHHGDYTAKSIPFADALGTTLTEDNASFSWDDATKVFNVGGTSIALFGELKNQGYLQFDDTGANSVQLSAPTNFAVPYSLYLPVNAGNPAQLLQTDGLGQLQWADPGITINDLNSFRADEIASKSVAMAASTVNLVLSGVPASADVDDVDFSTGGSLLVRAQTDPTENGLWVVDPFGAWHRDASMPDNGTSCEGALVDVQHGGTVYGDTLWISQCDGSGAVPFFRVPLNPVTSLTGEATGTGPGATAVTLDNAAVIGKVLTGYVSGAGAVAATDTILQAIQKLNGNDALYLPLTGGTLSGTLDLGANNITSSHIPAAGNDLTNKTYVDQVAANGVSKGASVYATTAALPVNVYANGASGVGATLTGFAFGALSVDGNAVVVGQRILVKNEATDANNGIYVVTATGGGAAFYVLTRTADFNQSSDIVDGATTFISSGATLHDQTWQLDIAGVVTVGTTSLVFNQIAGPGTIPTQTAPANQFFNSFTTPSNFGSAQPAFSNLSGLASQAQLPNTVVLAKVANYTLLTTDTYLTGSGTFNFTLPVATSTLKQPYTITNIGAGVLTILPNGADTIISIASITVNPGQSVDLYPDGVSNWNVR